MLSTLLPRNPVYSIRIMIKPWAVDKNKQIYIESSSTPEAAARIYDRAYIKFRGENCPNFPYSLRARDTRYDPQINLPGQDFIKMLRNMSRGDSLLWFTPEHQVIVSGIPNDKRAKWSDNEDDGQDHKHTPTTCWHSQ
ncbi:hypothetical protein SELMODRAFT_418978 [Selaginella moellendorffii]|uniref:AP2/ERF domain-containing protein n=1 Tax=Selaginella moellendorffii TaxID=88036 RepID=D8S7E9_SELML|nr:hypothetical protein SELMODRAFT_418978 [Selaginella moellendorffii]